MKSFLTRQKENIEIYRSSELISGRTKRMSIPYISSSLCVSVITAFEALIAGSFIGADALAAVEDGPDSLEEIIVRGLTIDTKYDRVLDLNHLTMFVPSE